MKKKSYKKKNKENNSPKKVKKIIKYRFLILGVISIILLGVLMWGTFYFNFTENNLLKTIYRRLPIPIVRVAGSNIFSSQLIQDTDAVQKFYQSGQYSQQEMRVDFSTRQGKIRLQIKEKDVLNKLVENFVIRVLAQERGIFVSDAEVDTAVEDSLQKSDNTYRQLELNLRASYGWSIDDFKNKVVKQQLYLSKLFEWYKKYLVDEDVYKKARDIEKRALKNNGEDFSELAIEFSEGDSAHQDGKISWIKLSQIVPEVASVVDKMQPGQISDIIISPLGLHIVKLEGRRKAIVGEDSLGEDEVQFRQIFLRASSFVNWVQAKKRDMPIVVFWKKYKWERDKGEISFNSDVMRRLEKEIRIKSQGDPSL